MQMHYTQSNVYELISQQTGDPIVERKTCAVSGTKFPITQKDIEFYEKVSPVFNGKKYLIPIPTLCPEERSRRRMAWRNERRLYRRKCDATNKSIISVYHPESHYTIYDQTVWWESDRFPSEPLGRTGDFIESFGHVADSYIRPSVENINQENSLYCNNARNSKDCYLLFVANTNQSVWYSTIMGQSTDCCDCYRGVYAQGCYESSKLHRCTNCRRSEDLIDCNDCLFCVGLTNKRRCILNTQYTKEQFENRKKQINTQEMTARYLSLKQSLIGTTKLSNTDGCYGNYIYDSSHCVFAFDCIHSQGCKFVNDSGCMEDSYDTYFSGARIGEGIGTLYYETENCNNSHQLVFCSTCKESSRLWYCTDCYGCEDCFGCIGLEHKKFYVFNKQYTKEEYETLVPKIIQQMSEESSTNSDGQVRGEFFSPSLSPFGYNETVAHEYYPLTKQEALDRGYNRNDYEKETKIPEGVTVLEVGKMTKEEWEALKDDDDILNQIIICEVSGKPFRIIKQELEFYRKHNLPLPTKHPDVRHQERLAKRPGRTLYLRTCDKTGEEMVSVYPQEFEGKVYSKEAYQEEVYG